MCLLSCVGRLVGGWADFVAQGTHLLVTGGREGAQLAGPARGSHPPATSTAKPPQGATLPATQPQPMRIPDSTTFTPMTTVVTGMQRQGPRPPAPRSPRPPTVSPEPAPVETA